MTYLAAKDLANWFRERLDCSDKSWHGSRDAEIAIALDAYAASLTAPSLETLPKLTSRERHKGAGDVLKDLAHAERMTDASGGYGELICRGNELDFVNRALRVAMGEIKQLRLRVKPAALAASPEGTVTHGKV